MPIGRDFREAISGERDVPRMNGRGTRRIRIVNKTRARQESRLATKAGRLSCPGGPHRDRTCDPLIKRFVQAIFCIFHLPSLNLT